MPPQSVCKLDTVRASAIHFPGADAHAGANNRHIANKGNKKLKNRFIVKPPSTVC
jgi:hypothetical protein